MSDTAVLEVNTDTHELGTLVVEAPATPASVTPKIKKADAIRQAMKTGYEDTAGIVAYCQAAYGLTVTSNDVSYVRKADKTKKTAPAKPATPKKADKGTAKPKKAAPRKPAATTDAVPPAQDGSIDLHASVRQLAAAHGLSGVRDALQRVEAEARRMLGRA